MIEAAVHDRPMSELNTTPLIDVMLVLLIMLIVTIPIQSHRVPVDLPTNGPVVPLAERNILLVDRQGQMFWNGSPIGMPALADVLDRIGGMPQQPELQLNLDPELRYERVDEVLALIKRANITAMGIVGNERYRDF